MRLGAEAIDLLELTHLFVRSSPYHFFLCSTPAEQATGQITGTDTNSDGTIVTGATIALKGQLTLEQNISKSSTSQHCLQECSSPPSADITLTIPSVNVSMQALSQHEIAAEQVKVGETQRILGVVPNYYAVYDWNAGPVVARAKDFARLEV